MSTRTSEHPSVYVGVDIGKAEHYAVAVDDTGATIRKLAVVNTETALRELVTWTQERHGALVIDQPGGTAALLLHLCWDAGVRVAYLHGLAMARARDFYAGEGKSDPKDAFVLADVARAHPSRLVWLTATAEDRAKLELLCGYDADLRADANRLTNRLRALLASTWPGLERTLGDRLDTLPVLALLAKYPSAPDLVRARRARLVALLRKAGARRPEMLIAAVLEAANAQTVTVAGAETAARIVAEVAGQLTRVLERRVRLEDEISSVFSALPEAPVLLSLPGIGPRLGARIAVEIGDIRRFPTADKLAAYAGLGPAPRQSGTSLKSNLATRHGNHRLKNAFFQAAFASLRHPPSRAYYDRKRAEGKRHNQAVLCLARRRVDVLHAMLKHNQPYSPPVSIKDAAVAA